MLSVICPIYNEEKYIGQCIESILHQDYPKDDLEVIFVDGLSRDKTKEIITGYQANYPFIKILDNPRRIVPCAMNIGIKSAEGDVIIRLDAHARYQPDYFSKLVEGLDKYQAENIGVVCRTDVLNKNPKSLAIKEVLSNKLGVGNSVFRTGIKVAQQVDTVPFGCWQKSIFDKIGLFDERLIRHQDFELNSRIIKNGGKIFIIPDTYCTYYARETYKALWRQNYNTGLWNIRTLKLTGRLESVALRHCIPMIFILSLLLPFIAGFFWWPLWLIGLSSFFAYLLAIITISLKLSITKRLNFIYLIFAFMSLHFSNGFGMIISLLTINLYGKQIKQSFKLSAK